MLLHTPPLDHGQGKEKRMKHSKGILVSNTGENKEVSGQDQEERPNSIDIGNCKGMDVDREEVETNLKELNQEMGDSMSKDEEMSERAEVKKVNDKEVNDKENRGNQEVRKPKYHFQNRRKPGSALAISRRDYHLLAQGRTLQHYNPKTGIVMSIRIKVPPQETSKQPIESQHHQNPHSPPMEKAGDIPRTDRFTHSTEGPDSTSLPMDNPYSVPDEVMREHTTEDVPTLQDCPPDVTPFEQSQISFQSITTGNRSPPRKAKRRASEKGVKKERRSFHRKTSCVLSNHVFQCRSKVEARFKQSDYPPSRSQNPLRYQCGMKRKSLFPEGSDSPHQSRKLVIIKNEICDSCLASSSCCTSVCSLPIQGVKFAGCMNCVRI